MGRYQSRRRQPEHERFWSRVDRSGNCWNWIGTKDRDGYGLFLVHVNPSPDPARICMHAHRYAWKVTYGDFPDAKVVCHHCDNPSCVRPDHLFLGTIADNNRDRDLKGRTAKGDRHWRFGRKQPFQYRMRFVRIEPGSRSGERNNRAKLTEPQVKSIIADGRRNTAIAAEYGVTATLIGLIKKGKIWTHVQRDLGIVRARVSA
jgi:hypothetical protein